MDTGDKQHDSPCHAPVLVPRSKNDDRALASLELLEVRALARGGRS